ncbi:MAG: 4-(cytidine 5'-diphospho)-2-C-methyl-D-erythritol kinase [Solirubrobacterales bacterium]
MRRLTCRAPGKLNLCLFLGPTRADGLHDLVSLFDSVSLHDIVDFVRRPDATTDSVSCEQVAGENLALTALELARSSGLLRGDPVELTIEKHIPVAAGMGGGSADAAAALRLIASDQEIAIGEFESLAFELGADVPSQLTPGAALVTGAGERVERLVDDQLDDASRVYVIVSQAIGLSTAEVFRAADASSLGRTDLTANTEQLRAAIETHPNTNELSSLVENDLAAAILGLRPDLSSVTDALLDAGAIAAAITGSGPTCFGVFDDRSAAERAAQSMAAEGHSAYVAEPVGAEFGAVSELRAANR